MSRERTFLQNVRSTAAAVVLGLSAATGVVPGPLSANSAEACGTVDFKLSGLPGDKTLKLDKGLTMKVGESYVIDGVKFFMKSWPKDEKSRLVEVTNGEGQVFDYKISRADVKCPTQDAILTLVGDVQMDTEKTNLPIERRIKNGSIETVVKISPEAYKLISQGGGTFDWVNGYFIDPKKVKVNLKGDRGEENYLVQFKASSNNKQIVVCLQDVKGNKVYRMSPEGTEDLVQLANEEYFRQCK